MSHGKLTPTENKVDDDWTKSFGRSAKEERKDPNHGTTINSTMERSSNAKRYIEFLTLPLGTERS